MKFQPRTVECAKEECLNSQAHDLETVSRRADMHRRYCGHMIESLAAGAPNRQLETPEFSIMLEALGWSVGYYGGRQCVGGWRNYYETDPEHQSWECVGKLVHDGYMALLPNETNASTRNIAIVTPKGMSHLRAHGYAVTDAWDDGV